jgi:hypothetical protein
MASSDIRTHDSGSLPKPPHDWRMLLRTGANMLVIGPRCALDAFLHVAGDELCEPVHLVRPSEKIPNNELGTLVLIDAARLDAQQRADLSSLFCDVTRARPQVLSLSESSLWQDDEPSLPLDLYYRLNTIFLELER